MIRNLIKKFLRGIVLEIMHEQENEELMKTVPHGVGDGFDRYRMGR